MDKRIAMLITFVLGYFLLAHIFCLNTFETSSGFRYHSKNKDHAEVMNLLRRVSFMLAREMIEKDDPHGKPLLQTLENTSFTEIIDNLEQNKDIAAWNVDKGREIAIRIESNGRILNPDFLIESVFHELAHSINEKIGHGPEWQQKYENMMKYEDKYVDMLTNNKFYNNIKI